VVSSEMASQIGEFIVSLCGKMGKMREIGCTFFKKIREIKGFLGKSVDLFKKIADCDIVVLMSAFYTAPKL